MDEDCNAGKKIHYFYSLITSVILYFVFHIYALSVFK